MPFENLLVLYSRSTSCNSRIIVVRTWWKAPLCQYFCRNFCWPLGFSARLFSACSRSSLSLCSSGRARRRSISSRSSSLCKAASLSRLMRASSRNRHASNSPSGSRPSVSSISGTSASFSSVLRQSIALRDSDSLGALSANSRLMLSATIL